MWLRGMCLGGTGLGRQSGREANDADVGREHDLRGDAP